MPTPTKRTPKIYSRLKGVIAQRVSQVLEANADDIAALSLDEEVAIARVAAEDVYVMYDTVATDAEKDPENQNLQALRASCAVATRSAAKEVASLVESATRVVVARVGLDDAVQAAVERVIKQVVNSAFHVFGDDPRVLELEEHLKIALRPTSYALGDESMTPGGDSIDKQLAAIDASIPEYEGLDGDDSAIDERDVGDGATSGEVAEA